MPEATFFFPADFKWGTATAAHQVEGGNENNDWWAWEQEAGHIKGGHRSLKACDWWERAEEDFDRAAALGQNAHRLSVEWSRVEPREGYFDDTALERYRVMLQALRARDIEPMVTLHHFTTPLWLVEMGGWESPRAIPLFERYVARVVEALGEFCDLWCTINEPNILAVAGCLRGIFPPGKASKRAVIRVMRNLLRGHAAAYRRIHALQPEARVGLAHNERIFDPAKPGSPLDRLATSGQDRNFNRAVLDPVGRGWWLLPFGFGPAWRVRKTLDWIGLNYYTRDLVSFDLRESGELFARKLRSPGAELLDGGFGELYPQGIARSLKRMHRLGLPIYITENGIPDADDDQRPRALVLHLHQVWRVIQECVPVMGYYHWSLVDNFEWAEGWTVRFGLIELDPETQERTPRPSAYLYRDICQANAITPAIIDEHVPELRSVLLPE
jgi:beta-glucosidase